MPKQSKKVSERTTLKVQHKNLVGTRKTGKSANQMSTVDLKAALENKHNSKYKNKINAVLAKRG